ncbi:MAG: hypothetical protein AAF798_14855 [Bacteroidota bacterium]
MTSSTFINGARFILLFLLQIFVFKRLSLGWEGYIYINVLIYPLFILLLPLRTPKPAILGLAFLMGLCIDWFYDSPGIHASASVFTAFMRPYVLYWYTPREGYNVNYSPTKKRMGLSWFAKYAATLLAMHIFWYFSVEAFTFFYLLDILTKTVFTLVLSTLVTLMIMLIFNPVD